MKRIIILVLIICFCCPGFLLSETVTDKVEIKSDDFLKKYRNYPFQWVFPEYYYKADIIRVEKEIKVPKGYIRVDFFGLSACIPSQYTWEMKRKQDIMSFKSKTGDTIMMIKSYDSSMLCTERNQYYMKDYCSAFSSVQELYQKLFILTPDTVQSMGDKFIVHNKGILFENAKNIGVYSDDLFVAYIKFIKDALVQEKKIKFSHEITLFHSNGPINSHITISFLANDDTLMKHLISTIE